jgi:predicted RNA-binding Zn-ribbon protein involved in translation (DUF1610 family)
MKVAMVCSNCGSQHVMRDAWAEWDVETQNWVLRGDPFDAAMCDDCDGETQIDEVLLDELPLCVSCGRPTDPRQLDSNSACRDCNKG